MDNATDPRDDRRHEQPERAATPCSPGSRRTGPGSRVRRHINRETFLRTPFDGRMRHRRVGCGGHLLWRWSMRFLVTWKVPTAPEAEQVRILNLFAQWKPPVDLQEWSGFADGAGGMAIAEVADATELA